MAEKKCRQCRKVKPLTDYYNHPHMADGHLNKCKDCIKWNEQARRQADPEKYRKREQKRANDPNRIAQRAAYQATARGKERLNAGKAAWNKRNPLKRQAAQMVGNAIRAGRLIKAKYCSKCGSGERLYGHHDDYSLPLVVRWLCNKCHRAWHKQNREAPVGTD